MDLSQCLKNLVEDDKQSDRRHKKLMELSMKKVQLEKNIRDDKLKLLEKQDELVNIRRHNVFLKNELLVREKRTEVVKESIEELLRKVVVVECESKNVQETFWKRINDFTSDGYRYVERVESQLAKANNKRKSTENKRKERMMQLKVEGQREAALLYEKYQRRKLDELKFIQELVEKEQTQI